MATRKLVGSKLSTNKRTAASPHSFPGVLAKRSKLQSMIFA